MLLEDPVLYRKGVATQVALILGPIISYFEVSLIRSLLNFAGQRAMEAEIWFEISIVGQKAGLRFTPPPSGLKLTNCVTECWCPMRSCTPALSLGFPKGRFCGGGGEISIVGVVRAPAAIINFAFLVQKLLVQPQILRFPPPPHKTPLWKPLHILQLSTLIFLPFPNLEGLPNDSAPWMSI